MNSFTRTTVVAGAALSTLAAMVILATHLGSKPAQAKQPDQPKAQAAAEDKSIRPFRVNISEEAVVDLRHASFKAGTKWQGEFTEYTTEEVVVPDVGGVVTPGG